MAPKLYGTLASPPVRAVLTFAKIIKLDLEFIQIDILKGEHLSDEFLKINPRHSLPTLDDDGHILWDSHAIMIYLADKYGNNNPLYPQNIEKRSAVNQLLFFECGDIFALHLLVAKLIIFDGAKEVSTDGAKVLRQGYAFLETFLGKTKFVAGHTMTIADLSIWTTLSNSRNFVPIDEKIYPNIITWMKVMDSFPWSDMNKKGAAEFKIKVDEIRGN